MPPGTRYHVLGELGAGGMGVVYEVVDQERQVHVALKMLRSKEGSTAEGRAIQLLRFKNEFRSLMNIHHRNLVSLYELVAEEDRWFFTMELVKGRDFLSFVRDEPVGEFPAGTSDRATITMSTLTLDHAGRASPPTTVQSLTMCDLTRLRAALLQLAAGIDALHKAGKVHRDIKPSNVLVEDGGRVVLLDFGLIMAAGTDPLAPNGIAGTPAYMAPEQAKGSQVGPAADAYSVGVMLFQALTGVSYDRVVMSPEPQLLVPEVPDDLNLLCRDLLSVEPARRPHGAELLARLGGHAERPASGAEGTFVGRSGELALLGDALVAAGRDGARCVVIQGDSGVGKTALVERFAQLAAAGARALVLRGRCYERESVPFKAFDAIADELSRHLTRLPDDDVQALLPTGMDAVARVFAVLESAGTASWTVDEEGADPRELRDRAFAALRELLARLATRGPVVIAIDDLQWSDEDSLDLLRNLLVAPAPRFLLVTTLRREHAAMPLALGVDPLVIELGNLPVDEAIALATTRAAELDVRIDGAAIAVESRGHPLFIAELVRHTRRAGSVAPHRLEDAIASRVDRLDAIAKDILELVSVVGAPIPERTIAAASGHDPGALAQALSLLHAESLVRSGVRRGGRSLETYHDRVRRAILVDVGGERLAGHSRRLAQAMEADGGEPELLGALWLGAGEPALAARHYQLAGLRAADALAFERAATLLSLARDLGASSPAVVERLGDVRAALGQTVRACDDLALAHASLAGDPPGQIRVALKLAEILRRRGLGDDAIAVLEPARASARAAGLHAAEASSELALARVKMYQADYAGAEGHLNAGIALVDPSRAPEILATLLLTRADVELFRGNSTQALRDVDAALAVGVRGDAQLANLHNTRGRVLIHRGDHPAAIDALDLAMTIYRRLNLVEQEAKVSNNLAAACFHNGQWDRALQSFLRCRDLAARMNDAQELSQALNNLGYVHLEQGDFARADQVLTQAMELARSAGREHVAAMSLGNRGEVHLRRHELIEARRCLDDALAVFTRIGAGDDRLETRRRLCAVTLAEDRAADALAGALELLAEPAVSAPEQIALACLAAAALRALARPADALDHLARARAFAGTPFDTATLDLQEGATRAATGDVTQARAHLERAIQIFTDLGARWHLERATQALDALP